MTQNAATNRPRLLDLFCCQGGPVVTDHAASRLPWRCRLFGHSAGKKFSGWIICSRCGKKLGRWKP